MRAELPLHVENSLRWVVLIEPNCLQREDEEAGAKMAATHGKMPLSVDWTSSCCPLLHPSRSHSLARGQLC